MLPFCSYGINFINENYRWCMFFRNSKHFPNQLWTIALKTWKHWHTLDLLFIVEIICRQDLTTVSTFKAIHKAYVRHSEWFIWGFKSVGWGLARIVFLMKNHSFEMSLFISWHTVPSLPGTEHKLHKVINTFGAVNKIIIITFLTKYFCINSDPTTRRNVAAVWFATAFANRVFPTKSHRISIKKHLHRCSYWEFLYLSVVHKLGFLFKTLSAVFWLISPQYICILLFLHMYSCEVLGGFLFLCPSPTKCFVSLVSMQVMHLICCFADHIFASPCHSNDSYSSH